jgi:hypothetical protein
MNILSYLPKTDADLTTTIALVKHWSQSMNTYCRCTLVKKKCWQNLPMISGDPHGGHCCGHGVYVAVIVLHSYRGKHYSTVSFKSYLCLRNTFISSIFYVFNFRLIVRRWLKWAPVLYSTCRSTYTFGAQVGAFYVLSMLRIRIHFMLIQIRPVRWMRWNPGEMAFLSLTNNYRYRTTLLFA